VSVSAYYGGAEGWLNGFYYFWIGLFAAYFFRSSQIAFQLAVVAVEYGLVLHYGREFRHGALVWFLTVTTLGVTTALVAFLRNRLERALALEHERVERLEELDRLKDDFLATVSHELRTPVTAVYGAAETLRMRPVDAETREELLRIVHAEATRLVELTNDLLQSTSIERGSVRLTLGDVDVLAVAADAAEAARLRAGSRPVHLRAPAGVASVHGDPQRLRQVLTNLLDNALKYSPPAEAVELEVYETESAVRLTVRDRGDGVPPQERERIFEKFHRLDPHMRRGIGGSGLGLYIVRGLVEAMRGRVWIEPSALGAGGTAVVVELPRSAPRAPAEEARREAPATSRSPGT
jgi:signal transduction histidine kinase